MNLFRTLLFITIILPNITLSQVNISIRVKQARTKESKLYLFQNSESILIDSSFQNSKGLFTFKLPLNYKQGVYKFVLGNNISFNFIIGSEPVIDLETVVYAAEDSLRSINSEENAQYIEYLKIKRNLNHRLWLINSLDDCYPDSSSFHKKLSAERLNTQLELTTKAKAIASSNPNLLVASIILLELKPEPKTNLSKNKNTELIKKEWWSNVNLSDDRLINSASLNTKIWNFIDLFANNRFDKEQQDSSYCEAVKIVMNLNASPKLKEYFRNNLVKSFLDTEYGMTTKFLVETSFDKLESLTLSPEEQNTYELQGKNKVGTKTKDFKITTYEGLKIYLSKVQANYKLIVFWSMWCPHCTEMLPELKIVYHNFRDKGFEVVAVCIDEEGDEWKKYIGENRLTWINTIEPDNGKNKIYKDYGVDGTPKFILVDKNQTIISCPTNLKQLEVKLNNLIKQD